MVQILGAENTQYKNRSNFIPIQIWHYDKYIRFHFPSVKKTTTTEWIFEPFQKELKDKWIRYAYDFYTINENIFFPKPRGCEYLKIINNELPPYNTLDILIAAYIPSIQSHYFDDKKNYSFNVMIAFMYPIPNTIPFLIWKSFDMNNNLILNYKLKPEITDQSLLKKVSNAFINYSIYLFINKPGPYWQGTSEYLCIPTHDESKYPTYHDCQEKIFNKIKNRYVWVETGSEPIYNYMNWWNNLPENTNRNINKYLMISNLIIFFGILILLLIILYIQLYK